jgi:hypothetical protein
VAPYVPFDRIEPKVARRRGFENLEQGHRDTQCTRDRKGMGKDLSSMRRPIDASNDVLGFPMSISLRVVLRNG